MGRYYDGSYNNENDTRYCPNCDFQCWGGSTATYWELHDHEAVCPHTHTNGQAHEHPL